MTPRNRGGRFLAGERGAFTPGAAPPSAITPQREERITDDQRPPELRKQDLMRAAMTLGMTVREFRDMYYELED